VSHAAAFKLMLYGFIVAEQLLLTICFFRFWRTSREAIFGFFSAGFLVMAIHRVLLGFTLAGGMVLEGQTGVFVVRFLSYALIFAGVVIKNLQRRSG
jgi:hypothetical protein